MEAAPTFTTRPEVRFAPSPLALALTLTVILTAVRATGSVDSDVAWQLWIAARLHAGARLYRDIIEVNPPLWFWLGRLIDLLARTFGLRPEPVLVCAMGTLAGTVLAATDRLLSHLPLGRRRLLLGYGAIVCMGLPWAHVGQREQIVLLTTIPYAALVAARHQEREVGTGFSAMVGLGAALGFALKHYFLLVPLALEAWLLLGKRAKWKLLRAETVALGFGGALYSAAVLIWARAYISDMIPLVSVAYGAVGASRMSELLGPFAVIGLSILGFIAAHGRFLFAEKAPFASGLFVCALAFTGSYFIQGKGWPYQAIPLIGCASLSLASLLAETACLPGSLRILAPALLGLPLVLGFEEQRQVELSITAVTQSVQDMEPGSTVGFLSVDNAIPWSVTLQHGFRFPSRYMSFWMLNAVARNEMTGNRDSRLGELGRRIVSETVEDFECQPPRFLVVARPVSGGGFDILAFFARNPDFADLMKRYRKRADGGLETYEQLRPLPRPAAPCRHGV